MPEKKSAEQINREYSALPWYSQMGTAASDIGRLALKGITFNQMPRIAAFLGGPGTKGATYDERLANENAADREAAIRAGFAGDVASVMGLGGAAKSAWKALPMLKSVVTNPTVLKLAGISAAAGANAAMRQEPTQAAAPAAAAPAATAADAGQQGQAQPTPGRMRSWYEGMGIPKNMTLGQLAMLSESMARTTPKPLSIEDQIKGMQFNRAEMALDAYMKDPNKTAQEKASYLDKHNQFLMAITQNNGLQDYMAQMYQNQPEGE